MSTKPFSERCSFMENPGMKERPPECPKDAAYIKTDGGTSIWHLGKFPIVVEGGEGNDDVKIVGGDGGILVDGGKGSDTVSVKSESVFLAELLGPDRLFILAVIALSSLVAIVISWRLFRTR